MTPTATYIAEENCLQEEPTMKKPELWEYFDEAVYQDESTFRDDDFKKAIREYKAHLATLRKIPCDTSCKGLWADAQKLVENVDYKLDWDFTKGTGNDVVAFPLVPVGEDLWEEFLQSVFDATGLNIANYPAGLKLLKSKYSLTKR